MAERITKAVIGQRYFVTGPERRKHPMVVAQACEKNRGLWHCITHDESFQNNFQKDSHIHTGKHCLVWVCFDHGPEVP